MNGHTTRAATGIPAGLSIVGDITASEDLDIFGQVDGQVSAGDHQVTLAGGSRLKAKVLARTITAAGTIEGSLTATEHVAILASANVRGHIHTPSLTLMEGATFNGTVDPERTEAAMHVARYRQKQQE